MDRLALARAVLAQAETHAGLHSVRTEHSAHLNGEVAADTYAVPDYLAVLYPEGIPRRGVLSVSSPFARLLLAGIAGQQNAWICVAGMADMSWEAAEKLGLPMSHVAYVPDLLHDDARVLSAAMDGFDVMLLGHLSVSRKEGRLLRRRALTTHTLILAPPLCGQASSLSCQVIDVAGMRAGRGHIRAVSYELATAAGTTRVCYGRSGVTPAPAQHTNTSHLHVVKAGA